MTMSQEIWRLLFGPELSTEERAQRGKGPEAPPQLQTPQTPVTRQRFDQPQTQLQVEGATRPPAGVSAVSPQDLAAIETLGPDVVRMMLGESDPLVAAYEANLSTPAAPQAPYTADPLQPVLRDPSSEGVQKGAIGADMGAVGRPSGGPAVSPSSTRPDTPPDAPAARRPQITDVLPGVLNPPEVGAAIAGPMGVEPQLAEMEKTQPGITERFDGWMNFLKQPQMLAAMMQLGTSLTNRRGNFWDVTAGSINDASQAYGRSESIQYAQQVAADKAAQERADKDREFGLDERNVRARERTADAALLRAQRAGATGGKAGVDTKELKELTEAWDGYITERYGGVELLSPADHRRLRDAGVAADLDGVLQPWVLDAIGETEETVLQKYVQGERNLVRTWAEFALTNATLGSGGGKAATKETKTEEKKQAPVTERRGGRGGITNYTVPAESAPVVTPPGKPEGWRPR